MSGRRIGPRAAGVLETEIGDDISLYHPMSETVAVLNSTASDVWRLCDGVQTLEEIVAALAGAYGVRHIDIADEVAGVVEGLVAQGFLLSTHQQGGAPV